MIKPKREFHPKGENQTEYIRAIAEKDLVLCTGPAGCGKTSCPIGLAVQYLAEGRVDKLVLTRPVIGVSHFQDGQLGFLQGGIREKLEPFLWAAMEQLLTYFSKSDLEKLISDGIIQLKPLYFLRGITFHDSFVILEEAQNCTFEEILTLITRLGSHSKIVINGDLDQADIDNPPLAEWINILGRDNDIGIVQLHEVDIQRHPLVRKVLQKVKKHEKR